MRKKLREAERTRAVALIEALLRTKSWELEGLRLRAALLHFQLQVAHYCAEWEEESP